MLSAPLQHYLNNLFAGEKKTTALIEALFLVPADEMPGNSPIRRRQLATSPAATRHFSAAKSPNFAVAKSPNSPPPGRQFTAAKPPRARIFPLGYGVVVFGTGNSTTRMICLKKRIEIDNTIYMVTGTLALLFQFCGIIYSEAT